MSILSGFKKVKNYRLTKDGFKLLSRWTSSQTVECDDGKTVENKIGSINGITDSLNATDSSIALSAPAGKEMNDKILSLSNNIDNKLDTDAFQAKYNTAITDCNYMFRGIFTTNTALHRPSNNWCAILSMPINDKFNLQIAMVLGSTNLYVRSSNNGIYLAWRKI